MLLQCQAPFMRECPYHPPSGMAAAADPPQLPNQAKPRQGRYRLEIDGLRAFAVIAVIINHFDKDLLPSGYLGVDIFFVISGYVITSSLSGRESKSFVDFLLGFYERRIKRLVPALVVLVLVTSLLICLFNPEPRASLTTGVTSLFGFSNLYLFKESTDYFAPSTEFNPFTHTWSLGVEEQFYLLFPFLIWFSGFGRQAQNGARNLFLWIGALTVASLTGFIYLYQSNQPAAYFLMPLRFWEMAAGCLVLVGFQKRAQIEQALERMPPILVLTAIVGVMFMPTSFAATATVLIVVLSVFLLACLKSGTAAFAALTNRSIVYLGQLSYSLYLWHWVVLSIARWTIGVTPWSTPFLVVAVVAISIVSYQFIEFPLRRCHWFSARWKSISSALAFLTLAAATVLLLAKNGASQALYLGKASNSVRAEKQGTQVCDAKSRRQIAILGDSHADQLNKVFSTPLLSCDYAAKAFNHGIYPPIPAQLVNSDGEKRRPEDVLSQYHKISDQYDAILAKRPRRGVLVVSNRYLCRLSRDCYSIQLKWKTNYFYSESGGLIGEVQAQDAYIRKLLDVAVKMQNKDITMVVVMPTPEIKNLPPLCRKEWFRRRLPEGCTVDPHTWRSRAHFKKLLESRLAAAKNIIIYDPWNRLCKSDEKCASLDPSSLSDATHISARGANEIAASFREVLDSIPR